MIYKEASRRSKLRMFFQLLPIFCSASYLLHNLFRKAFLNTSLLVKSWNRHLVLEKIRQRDSTLQRQVLQTQDLTTMPQHTSMPSHLDLDLYSATPGTTWSGLSSGMCSYMLSSLRKVNCHPGWLSSHLAKMLVRFVLNQTINKRFKHMSD